MNRKHLMKKSTWQHVKLHRYKATDYKWHESNYTSSKILCLFNLLSWINTIFKAFLQLSLSSKEFQISLHLATQQWSIFSRKTIGSLVLSGCPCHLSLYSVRECIKASQNILKTITVWKIICVFRIENYFSYVIYIITSIQEESKAFYRPLKRLYFYHFLPFSSIST